ncbi:hypothetical protein XSR1_230054 [Xenorhabdus szentirmaii DSM 16338]|uniref:Uncharacterized protein n=1 Tax=Xenorhabdus szentirmaii DSM 16338 TaxID=1427518 RepID=W1IW71_9GAMM|nr:hypothetical protein XSR1_230054 [Xenorhabdus szentirmaii DSM 16338]
MFIKTVTGVNERSQQRGNLKDDGDKDLRKNIDVTCSFIKYAYLKD